MNNGKNGISYNENKGEILNEVIAYKDYLVFTGKYNCCLDDPCNYCLFDEGYCDCRYKLFNGEEICGECLGEWIEGNGHKCPMMVTQFSIVYPDIWKLIKDKYDTLQGSCHA